MLERFVSVVGCGTVFERKPRKNQVPHWKPSYRYNINGAKARATLAALLPWLGERRRARAQEMLASCR